MDTILHAPGTTVRLRGDRRYPDNPEAVVLDNSHYPLYHVRLGSNQFDTKAKSVVVQASKLTKQ